MSNLGIMKVSLLNVRIAGTPTFIPGADPKRHHCMMTVICNRGKNPNTQEEMSDEITLNFWGKYAQTAANYLNTGREINVEGELRSYRHQTGILRPDGKPGIERRVEVLVNRFFFGKDSMKELGARVNAKIAELKSLGRINADAVVSAEELLAVTRPTMVDYSPALVAQTGGLYGHARVWNKGTGFVAAGQIIQPVGAVVAPGAVVTPGAITQPVDVQAMVNTISQLTTSLKAAGIDPFAAAGGAAT